MDRPEPTTTTAGAAMVGDILARHGAEEAKRSEQVASMNQSENINLMDLVHHGVLGMKWGHRKGASSKPSASGHTSADHQHTEAVKAKIDSHGLKSLSNQELKKFNERSQLEQNYRNLNAQKPSKFETGHQRVKKVIAVGKTLNDIHNTLNGPAGKLAKTALKTAVKGAAKTAEAAVEE